MTLTSKRCHWAEQFGSDYFKDVPQQVVDALAVLEDQSWSQNSMPEFVLAKTHIDGDEYALRAWVGFDENMDEGDHNEDKFVFALGLNVNDVFEPTWSSMIEDFYSDINPKLQIGSPTSDENNAAIIELIQKTRSGFPEDLEQMLLRML